MKKFTAHNCDLTVELKTLSGAEVTLKTDRVMNAQNVKELMIVFEKDMDDQDGAIKASKSIDVLATQLTNVYGNSNEWYLKELDFNTMKNIIEYVAKELVDQEKK